MERGCINGVCWKWGALMGGIRERGCYWGALGTKCFEGLRLGGCIKGCSAKRVRGGVRWGGGLNGGRCRVNGVRGSEGALRGALGRELTGCPGEGAPKRGARPPARWAPSPCAMGAPFGAKGG